MDPVLIAAPYAIVRDCGKKDGGEMADREPNLITSSLSRTLTISGVKVKVGIYRLDDQPGWTLEAVDVEGTSTVWDDAFETDEAAYAMFLADVADEGIAAVLGRSNVIPFRR